MRKKKRHRTVLVSKQLKEKCRILTEEQFLKYFVDDAWETRKQMMLIRSLFVFRPDDGVDVVVDDDDDDVRRRRRRRRFEEQKQLSNIDPTSPLDDDVTTTATNSKENKLPL